MTAAKPSWASGARDVIAGLALIGALAAPAFFAYAALGTRFGLHDWRFGLGALIREIGPKLLIGVLALGVLSLIGAALIRPRRGFLAAVLAIAVSVGAFAFMAQTVRTARALPPIHDISTDLENRPTFSQAVLDARGPDANPVDLADERVPDGFGPAAGRTVADLQREAYPDVQPLPVGVSPAAAYDAALQTAQGLGWEIVSQDQQAGVFEAQVQSFWFGFVDDIVVRVTPTEAGAVIDVRSVSRVGVSDLGANAARIRAFAEALPAALTP
jgi:uncharacterized protein (DUF1499 family)